MYTVCLQVNVQNCFYAGVLEVVCLGVCACKGKSESADDGVSFKGIAKQCGTQTSGESLHTIVSDEQ